MRIHLVSSILFLLFTLAIESARAQFVQLEPNEFVFRIVETNDCQSGECLVTLQPQETQLFDYPTEGRYFRRDAKHSDEAYLAEQVDREDGKYYYRVLLPPSDYILSRDDLIVLPLKVAKNQYRSLFFELARVGTRIEIEDESVFSDRYLYNLDDLWEQDSPEKEEKLIQLLIQDIRKNTISSLKEEEQNQIIQSGYYRGQTLKEVIAKFSKIDIQRFLNLIKEQSIFWGRDIIMTHSVGIWLQQNAPLAHHSFWSLINQAQKVDALKKLIEIHQFDAQIKVKRALEEGITYVHGGQLDSAQKYLELVSPLVPHLDEPEHSYHKAYLHSEIARLQKDNQTYLKQSRVMYQIAQERTSDNLMIELAYRVYDAAQKAEEWDEALKYLLEIEENYLSLAQPHAHELYEKIAKTYEQLQKSDQVKSYTQKRIEHLKNQNSLEALREVVLYYDGMQSFDTVQHYAERLYQKARQEKNTNYQALGAVIKAQAYYHLEKYSSSRTNYEESVKLADQSDNNYIRSFCLPRLAALCEETGKPREAIGKYIQLLQLNQVVRDTTSILDTRNHLSNLYLKTREFDKALAFLEQNLAVCRATRDSLQIANTISSISSIYWEKGAYTQAREQLQKALAIYAKLGNTSGIIDSYASIGHLYLFFDIDYKKAEIYLDKAIALAQTKEDYLGSLAFCYERKASLYYVQGKSETSREYNQKAMEIYQGMDWSEKEGRLLLSGASEDNLADRLTSYDKALEIGEKLKDKALIREANVQKALVYSLQGDFKKALDVLDRNIKIYQETDNLWGLASTYELIGNVYITSSDFQRAKAYILKADSIYQVMEVPNQKINTYQNLGRLYFYQSNYEKSYENHLKSFKLRDSLGMRDGGYETAAQNVGECLHAMGRCVESREYMRLSLQNAQKRKDTYSESSAHKLLGKFYLCQQNYRKAITQFEKALSYGQKNDTKEFLAQVYLGLCKAYYGLGDEKKAISAAQQTIALSKNIGTDYWAWEVHYILGLIYKSQADLDKSKTSLKEAIDIIEAMGAKISGGASAQQLFMAEPKKVKVYEVLIELLIETEAIDEARSYLERNNQEELREKFKDLLVESGSPSRD